MRGRAGLSSISLPSYSPPGQGFILEPAALQPPEDTAGGSPLGASRGEEEEGPALVGSVRFVVPVRELVGLYLGRRVERRVADLSAEIAACRRTPLFHSFSDTGCLA